MCVLNERLETFTVRPFVHKATQVSDTPGFKYIGNYLLPTFCQLVGEKQSLATNWATMMSLECVTLTQWVCSMLGVDGGQRGSRDFSSQVYVHKYTTIIRNLRSLMDEGPNFYQIFSIYP